MRNEKILPYRREKVFSQEPEEARRMNTLKEGFNGKAKGHKERYKKEGIQDVKGKEEGKAGKAEKGGEILRGSGLRLTHILRDCGWADGVRAPRTT